MSTRANIILKEGNNSLYFYRHSDGYPKGTMPTLNKFIGWLKAGKIRNCLQQGSGWLIVLGALEYNTIPEHETEKETIHGREYINVNFDTMKEPKDWKVGAYEPTTCIHGDIEYLYTIDLVKKELTVQKVDFNYTTKKQTLPALNNYELA